MFTPLFYPNTARTKIKRPSINTTTELRPFVQGNAALIRDFQNPTILFLLLDLVLGARRCVMVIQQSICITKVEAAYQL